MELKSTSLGRTTFPHGPEEKITADRRRRSQRDSHAELGLAQLSERQRKWSTAASHYRRALELKPQPVVVICTGYANMTNARQALMMHVHYLATKPVELDELKSNLARLIAIRDNNKGGR